KCSPGKKVVFTTARSTTSPSGSIPCGTGSPTCSRRAADAHGTPYAAPLSHARASGADLPASGGNVMITRRRFNVFAGVGATALASLPYLARGQSLPVVRLGNAAGIIDTQVIFLTMGQHPRLKFYEEEGCRMEILNLSGVGQSIQAIASGNCDTSAVSPTAFL